MSNSMPVFRPNPEILREMENSPRVARVPAQRTSPRKAAPVVEATPSPKKGRGKGKSPAKPRTKSPTKVPKYIGEPQQYVDDEGNVVQECFEVNPEYKEVPKERAPSGPNHHTLSQKAFTVDRYLMFGIVLRGDSGNRLFNATYKYATAKYGSFTGKDKVLLDAYQKGHILRIGGIHCLNIASILDEVVSSSSLRKEWTDFKNKYALPSKESLQKVIRENPSIVASDKIRELLEKNTPRSGTMVQKVWALIAPGEKPLISDGSVNYDTVVKCMEVVRDAIDVERINEGHITDLGRVVSKRKEEEKKKKEKVEEPVDEVVLRAREEARNREAAASARVESSSARSESPRSSRAGSPRAESPVRLDAARSPVEAYGTPATSRSSRARSLI